MWWPLVVLSAARPEEFNFIFPAVWKASQASLLDVFKTTRQTTRQIRSPKRIKKNDTFTAFASDNGSK